MKKQRKIWIDEAWRGAWFWPVVACSIAWKEIPENVLSFLKDSKKLSPQKRKEVFFLLQNLYMKGEVLWGIGVVDNSYIDRYGIKEATKEAMKRSLEDVLYRVSLDWVNSVLIDGNDHFSFEWIPIKPIFIIDGDEKVPHISAASIVAKHFRDSMMHLYASLYPSLGIENHKGYGTQFHKHMLETNFSYLTVFHRKSFTPIKHLLHTKPALLIHACCAPDVCIPILDLKEHYTISVFWYNPNIFPKEEYEKRKEEVKRVCERERVPLYEWPYEGEYFYKAIGACEKVEREWGTRCYACYEFRMKKTYEFACKHNISFWTTSLTLSPHKNVDAILSLWKKYSCAWMSEFLPIIFRKNHGVLRSVAYCKQYNVYRQKYCGCVFSYRK